MARRRNLKDRRAIVIGGSSGIGLATARLLAAAGAHVTIAARRTDVLQRAAAEIQTACGPAGHEVAAVSLDVADRGAVADFAREYARSHGAPDIVINSAGITYPGYFEDIPYEVFEEIMQIDYFGVLHVCRSFVPLMKAKGGHIVNVASAAGLYGVFGYTAYSAAKFAVVGFSQVLRSELKPYGLLVSVLCPVDTDTPQLELENRLKPKETRAVAGTASGMTPEAVAAGLVRALFTDSFLVIPGAEGKLLHLVARVAPRILDRYLDAKVRKVWEARP